MTALSLSSYSSNLAPKDLADSKTQAPSSSEEEAVHEPLRQILNGASLPQKSNFNYVPSKGTIID